jgi:uncharacterized protein (TIGR03083 family)
MTPGQMLAALDEQSGLLWASADRAGLDTVVPSCPEWSVRELVRHMGMVHRWATAVVVAGGPAVDDTAFEAATVYPADDALGDWFGEGAATLVSTLGAAAPDHQCWAFMRGSPTPLVFWIRRQLHETSVHRMDAERAAGAPLSPVSPAHAADGDDELLMSFLPRRSGRLRSAEPWTMAVHARDTDNAWTVRVSQEPTVSVRKGQSADVTLTGNANDLYAFLWNRGTDGVIVAGDTARVGEWRDKVRIGW